jgi:LuxR family maltose regulon positive regulatory protein
VAAARASQRHAPPPAAPSATAAIESFSEREREVLNLVAQALPNKKIARVLGVTPHTVKWHLRKIYAKLGVAERDEAVARLRDMELGRENTGGPGGAN